VVSSASVDELERLASIVDEKLAAVVPAGRAITPQAMLLAAMSLAHDAEEARLKSRRLEEKSRRALARVVSRVDEVMSLADAALASSQGDALQD
jgi:cell division protein ZapA